MNTDKYNPNSLDSVVARIETNTQNILARLDAHSARITAVEKKMWYWGGALGVLALFAPIIARHLWK